MKLKKKPRSKNVTKKRKIIDRHGTEVTEILNEDQPFVIETGSVIETETEIEIETGTVREIGIETVGLNADDLVQNHFLL